MRFEFIAGALCLDFANTIHDSRAQDKEEELHAISDLLQWAKEAHLLSRAAHDCLAAHYQRNSRDAKTALARGMALRDFLISIFAGIANGRPVSSRHLSRLNSALAQVPGLLRVYKDSGRIEAGWMSAADGLQRICFAVLTSAAELLGSDRLGRIRECASTD